MGDDLIWYSANVPADFPTHDEIVTLCQRAGFDQNGAYIRVAGGPQFWVKYGRDSSSEVKAVRRLM